MAHLHENNLLAPDVSLESIFKETCGYSDEDLTNSIKKTYEHAYKRGMAANGDMNDPPMIIQNDFAKA